MSFYQAELGTLVKAHYGKALKKENRNDAGVFDVYGSSGQVGFHIESICDYPTLVVGRKGSVGDIVWAPKGGWVIDTAYFLEILTPDILDLRYLFYALKRANLANKTITTSIPGLNRDDFYETKIPLPQLAEQKRIAAILDKADSLRRKNQRAIQLADQFLRAVFLDMFGDPVTNPKGWEIKQWQEVLSIVNGKNQKKVEVEKGAYPIYGSGGSEMGRANDYLCFENSIIIGRKGNINKPILIKEKFWNVDTAFGLTSKKELISFQYLYWFCIFFDFEKLNKTVTIPSLTKSDLLEIEMPIPSMDLQIRFEKICTKIDSQNILVQSGSIKVNNLFNSLSQKAFVGEL
jgi:type I restriction enzyme S subunit